MLLRSLVRRIQAIAAIVTVATTAVANSAAAEPTCIPLRVPWPPVSAVPRSIPTCPAGDLVYSVWIYAHPCPFSAPPPIENARVVLGIVGCATTDTCDAHGGLIDYTDRDGLAELYLHAGGGPADSCFTIDAEGVQMGNGYLASTDQDGDLDVDADDVQALIAKIGTADRSGDIDQDGAVTDTDVSVVHSHMRHVCLNTAGVSADQSGVASLVIREPRPNPARGDIVIPFQLGRPGEVRMAVYDLLGRAVRDLTTGPRSAGAHRIVWDAKDDHGTRLRPGVYMIRGQFGALVAHRNVVVLEP